MSNETCVVSIADIYGEEWWSKNKEELDREWEWSFKLSDDRDLCIAVGWGGLKPFTAGMYEPCGQPRIILHRRKPKTPTLRDVYGVDSVTIPAGWEWTGEWKVPVMGDKIRYCGGCSVMACGGMHSETEYRLILRERKPKVWFKAEEEARVPRSGDWFFAYGMWDKASTTGDAYYLCATRHEEIDQTVQVVTQADLDKVVK